MLNKLRKLREKKGFTLVELIVVIAIIAILTAVLVPLVGRYSAQASYAMAQDTAKSISNVCNTTITDLTLTGKTYSSRIVYGCRNGTNGMVLQANTKEWKSGSTMPASPTQDESFLKHLYDGLSSTIDRDCQFIILVGNNTVDGVVFTNSVGASPSYATFKECTVKPTNEFEQAYVVTINSSDEVVGVSGKFIPTADAGHKISSIAPEGDGDGEYKKPVAKA